MAALKGVAPTALRGLEQMQVAVGEVGDDRASEVVVPDDPDAAGRFRAFFAEAEPRLRRALVAAYGPELGSDAAADALAWAWENFDRIEAMRSPLGYLWRVGQTSVRRTTRRRHRETVWNDPASILPLVIEGDDRLGFEPRLLVALGRLTQRQRVAVVLVHGYRYQLAEVAEIQGCGLSTVRNHLQRGMAGLRAALGVGIDA